jgi:hypothetical protein
MQSIDQMNSLIDILLDLDKNSDNLPITDKIELYSLTQNMLDNPEIYGDVRDIVTTLHNDIYNGNHISYGLVAVNICSYLPIS